MEQDTLLEKYLQNKLSKSEQKEFDSLLETDPDFKEEVEFQKDVKLAVTAGEDEEFKDLLAKFENEARAEERKATRTAAKKVKTLPTKWLAAASMALLIGLGYFFMADQATDPQDLFAQNFKPYRNVTHPNTRGEGAADTRDKAFSAYAKGDYMAAVPLFTQLYSSEKEPYYLFYKANALIQMSRAAEAIPLLQAHVKTKDSLSDKSNWYLAMAYLQLEDTEKAKLALKSVVETKTYKAEEAKQLLDAL